MDRMDENDIIFLICDHNLSYRSHKGAKKQLPVIVHSQFTSYNRMSVFLRKIPLVPTKGKQH